MTYTVMARYPVSLLTNWPVVHPGTSAACAAAPVGKQHSKAKTI